MDAAQSLNQLISDTRQVCLYLLAPICVSNFLMRSFLRVNEGDRCPGCSTCRGSRQKPASGQHSRASKQLLLVSVYICIILLFLLVDPC